MILRTSSAVKVRISGALPASVRTSNPLTLVPAVVCTVAAVLSATTRPPSRTSTLTLAAGASPRAATDTLVTSRSTNTTLPSGWTECVDPMIVLRTPVLDTTSAAFVCSFFTDTLDAPVGATVTVTFVPSGSGCALRAPAPGRRS